MTLLVPVAELRTVAPILPVGDHALFLWTAVATHALVGYTLGATLLDAPWAGLVGGTVADVDLLFPLAWGTPFVHRGLTHTALVGALLALAVARWRRSAGLAVGVGYASQLVIDATTPMGVPLLYPLSDARVGVALGGHSEPVTALIWVVCLGALYRRRRRDSASRRATVRR